jgi:hypothetical protein
MLPLSIWTVQVERFALGVLQVIARRRKSRMLHRVVIIALLAGVPHLGSGCEPSKPCCGAGNPAQTTSAQTGVPASDSAGRPVADCCAPSAADQAAATSLDGAKTAKTADPDRQIVLKVEGLTCPAVKGLGCGHRIAPVLARLNKIAGVEKSFSNRTGTMLRISVASSGDREKVAAAVSEDLTKDSRKPVLLAGDEFKQSLVKEEWSSPGDLSAIEFRTFALHRVKTFAEVEKLNKEATDKLVKIAEQQWERMAKGGDCCGKAKQPGDWLAQFKQFAASVPDQAKELLTAQQAERLRQVLTKRFEEKDMPIAADAKQKE